MGTVASPGGPACCARAAAPWALGRGLLCLLRASTSVPGVQLGGRERGLCPWSWHSPLWKFSATQREHN